MTFRNKITMGLVFGVAFTTLATAQDSRRGRKYKVPPPTSHIEVEVLKGYNQKPVANAAVIFHAVKDGVDEGNLEVKTNDDGKAMIDVIDTGSTVDVQVIADGFATYADKYQVNEATRMIQVKMQRPRAQVSAYVDNKGQESTRAVGVQEPAHGSTPPVIQNTIPTNNTSDPNPRAPVDPGATPGNSQNQQTGPKASGVPPQL